MAFQFNQIDRIKDFDEAIAALESEYLPRLIEAFSHSPEGQAYLKAHPEEADLLGTWAESLIRLGYTYLEVTLPKMQPRDVDILLRQIFPSKVALSEPDDANSIVPELIAFWKFVQREYRQRNSDKILTFLHKIEPTFAATMNDPRNFGIAKTFFMSGQSSGFDMTTPEGVAAYQEEYNRQIRENPSAARLPLPRPPMPMGLNPFAGGVPEGVPPEFVALMSQQLGLGPVPGLEHLPTDPEALVSAIAQHLVNEGIVTLGDLEDADLGEDDENPLNMLLDFPAQLQRQTLQHAAEEQSLALSEAAIALLQDLRITPTTPGPIVQDFDTLLERINAEGIPVSNTHHQISLKILPDLNAQLSQPIQIDLKRPQQKSYPNLYGLYLLLRVTGLTQIHSTGKTSKLVINPDRYAAWQTLNPTEKYFTLLEAWLIRGDLELLGEDRNPLNEGSRVLRAWVDLSKQPKTYRNYAEQDRLNYWPGFHNLTLMQMFGWVELVCPRPDAGKGWRVKQVKPTPIGDAIATVALSAYYDQEFHWASEDDFTLPWGDFQPYFQPYFPEWQQNLPALQPSAHQTGTYIFKVSLGKIWRRLSISSEMTLEALGDLIRESVNFDSDHLDLFSFKDAMGRTVEIHSPHNDWREGKATDEVLVGDLPLQPGMALTYLFDFGACWTFNVQLEEIQPGKPKRGCNKILERHGKSPEQYPNWDEDEEDE